MSQFAQGHEDPEYTKTGWDGDTALAWQDVEGFWHLATFDSPEARQQYAVELGTDHGILSHFLDHLELLNLNDIADGKVNITDDYTGGEVSVIGTPEDTEPVAMPGVEEFLAVGDAKDIEDDESENDGAVAGPYIDSGNDNGLLPQDPEE